jgi:hypothetical protein
MQTDQMDHHIRTTRIYKGLYCPSSNLLRFLGAILSILLHGYSPLDSTRIRNRRTQY